MTWLNVSLPLVSNGLGIAAVVVTCGNLRGSVSSCLAGVRLRLLKCCFLVGTLESVDFFGHPATKTSSLMSNASNLWTGIAGTSSQ